MSLTLSDVNKKVTNIVQTWRRGRLLGLSQDHTTAFVEWDSPIPSQRKREPVEARLLKIVEETGTENAGGASCLSTVAKGCDYAYVTNAL